VRNALVSDFDGTITRNDFYVLIARKYLPPQTADYFDLYREGRLSHFEAMAAYFSHMPSDDDAIQILLRATEPDPELASAANRLKNSDWDLIIVSAGSAWYIDRILAEAGVHAVVHSNPGKVVPGQGLVLERPKNSPFFSEEVGVDKAAVVRDAQARYERVAFAGDGPPDIAAALPVSPDLRFARGFLAQELRRKGEKFREFERWSEVVEALV
jgi:2-hydroxy-3-keto-5-methylthiopentenyl-1-phosphate phosphatase